MSKVCSICGKHFYEWGNNPRPFSGNTCCDECNRNVVLKFRMFESDMLDCGLFITPEDTPLTIKYVKVDNFKDIQRYVGGHVTSYTIRCFNGLEIFMDEDGILKSLKPNKLIHELYGVDVLGNVLVLPKNVLRKVNR